MPRLGQSTPGLTVRDFQPTGRLHSFSGISRSMVFRKGRNSLRPMARQPFADEDSVRHIERGAECCDAVALLITGYLPVPPFLGANPVARGRVPGFGSSHRWTSAFIGRSTACSNLPGSLAIKYNEVISHAPRESCSEQVGFIRLALLDLVAAQASQRGLCTSSSA